jgi:hypothetical protein
VGFKRRDGGDRPGGGRDDAARSERPHSARGAEGARVPTTGAERRVHERVERHGPVTLETHDGAEFDTRSLNVSRGGMFVTGDFFIPPCTIVRVKPAGDGAGTMATVVRARDLGGDFGMGLWFDRPDNDNRDGDD